MPGRGGRGRERRCRGGQRAAGVGEHEQRDGRSAARPLGQCPVGVAPCPPGDLDHAGHGHSQPERVVGQRWQAVRRKQHFPRTPSVLSYRPRVSRPRRAQPGLVEGRRCSTISLPASSDPKGSQLRRAGVRSQPRGQARPVLLSDRVKAWLDELPEAVVHKGLLLADVADAHKIGEKRGASADARGVSDWWPSLGVGSDRLRWLPPWAPGHPEEREWMFGQDNIHITMRKVCHAEAPAGLGRASRCGGDPMARGCRGDGVLVVVRASHQVALPPSRRAPGPSSRSLHPLSRTPSCTLLPPPSRACTRARAADPSERRLVHRLFSEKRTFPRPQSRAVAGLVQWSNEAF